MWKNAGSLQHLEGRGSQSLISSSGVRTEAIIRKHRGQEHPYCPRKKISIIKGKPCLQFTGRVGKILPGNSESLIFSNLGLLRALRGDGRALNTCWSSTRSTGLWLCQIKAGRKERGSKAWDEASQCSPFNLTSVGLLTGLRG